MKKRVIVRPGLTAEYSKRSSASRLWLEAAAGRHGLGPLAGTAPGHPAADARIVRRTGTD